MSYSQGCCSCDGTLCQKQTQEEIVYFTCISMALFTIQRTRDRDLEVGADDAHTVHGEGVLLLGLFFITCLACLFIKPRITSPGVAPPTVGWASLISH